MKKVKIVFRLLWCWLKILWRKHILRKKPAGQMREDGVSVSRDLMQRIAAVEKLMYPVDAEGRQYPPLIQVDIERPIIYIGISAYRAFMCGEDKKEDRDKSLGFLSNILLYVNFTRNYVRGLIESEELSDAREESDDTGEGRPKLDTMTEEAWIPFLVAVDDAGTAIYKSGRYRDLNGGELEISLYEPEKHPVEAAMEKAERIRQELEREKRETHA